MAESKKVSELVGSLLEGIAGRMEDVAREAGVSYSALYSWATGRRRPGRQNLEKLASLAERRSRQLDEIAAELRARLDRGAAGGGAGDSASGGGAAGGGPPGDAAPPG